MKEKMPQALALVALIAALGVSVLLLFIPVYKGETTPPTNVITGMVTGQPREISATLLEVNGPRVLIPLAIPPLLAAAGLLAVLRARRWRRLLIWVAAFLLAVFVFLTGFSIGMFYVPAMILLVVCAILTQSDTRRNAVG